MLSNSRQIVYCVIIASIFAVIPQISHLSPVACLIILFLFCWRGALTFSKKLVPSESFLKFLSIGVCLISCGYQQFVDFGLSLDLIITLLCVTITLKIFELNTSRDFVVAFGLLLFLIGVDLCYSQDKNTAMLCTVAAFFLFLAMILNSDVGGKLSVLNLSKTSLATWVIVAPLTAAFTAAFPLDGLSKWSLVDGGGEHSTGISDSMSPGDVPELNLSEDLAFEGRFLGNVPAKSSLYWRGSVLSSFDGRRWSASVSRGRDAPAKGVTGRRDMVEYELKLEPSSGWWVPVLDAVARIEVKDAQASVFAVGRSMEIRTSPPFTEEKRFLVRSHLEYSLDADLSPSDLGEYLHLPKNNNATKAYGVDLANRFSSKPDIVNAVLDTINTQQFSYRLDPSAISRRNPVDDFWFKTKNGFCEHYASAFALIMRSAGIPSRVVTGYMGATELNEATGEFQVLQSEAHAWNEVWLQGLGWVRVDPTASIHPSRVAKKKPKSLIKKFTSGLFKFSGAATGLFSFNEKLSRESDAAKDLTGGQAAEGAAETSKISSGSGARKWLFGLTFTTLIIAMFIVYKKTRRNNLVMAERLTRCEYELELLARCFGVRRKSSEGLREFGVRVCDGAEWAASEKLNTVIRDLERFKYGGDQSEMALVQITAEIRGLVRVLSLSGRVRHFTNKAIDKFLFR